MTAKTEKISDNNVAEKTDFQGKTTDELLKIEETLINQAQQYHILTLKAQGALEVIRQMLGKDEGMNEG